MTKTLVENWQDSPLLEYLRWNVELVFIPLVNPHGFISSRQNANGVDLNRNFSVGWNLAGGSTDPESPYFKGTSPASEKETQYVQAMIDEHSDAIFFGDYHTNASSGNNYNTLMWNLMLSREMYSEDVAIASSYFIGKATREFIKAYDLPEDEGLFGYMSQDYLAGSAMMYGGSKGIDSATIESFRKFPTETEYLSDTNMKATIEYIVNWLLTVVKQYSQK